MIQPTPKDIENLIEHKNEIVNPPKKKGRPSHYKDKERVNKLRADAKWDARLAEVTTRLLASGFTYADVGVILGVSGNTVTSWTQRYPDCKEAAEKGHAATNAIILGQMLRSAWGFEYVEKTEKRAVTLDEGGEEIPAESNKVIITIHTKYQSPNADLLKFLALNRMSSEFKDSKRLEIMEDKTIRITGLDEAKQLDSFIQNYLEHIKKTKQIESREISNEQ